MNSLIRFKWALTEDRPAIKAYDEKGWAELPDARSPIGLRLTCSTRFTAGGRTCSAA